MYKIEFSEALAVVVTGDTFVVRNIQIVMIMQ